MVDGAAGIVPALPLEDDHEPVARRLVDVAVMRADDLEEAREVGLHELVEALGLELLGQPRIAGDVEKEDGDLLLPLLELGGRGVALEQLLDGVGNELGQLALELFEHFQTLA